MDEAEIDFDFPGKRKLSENIPVIELKPQRPLRTVSSQIPAKGRFEYVANDERSRLLTVGQTAFMPASVAVAPVRESLR